MGESSISRRDRCPACLALGKDRRGDNLVVYSDGHAHCFSCGYHVTPEGFKPPQEARTEILVQLPHDVTKSLPAVALEWLAGYDIAADEVRDNFLVWSPSRQLLIFPFYGDEPDDLVVAWQGRWFQPNRPKYYTLGHTDKVFAYQNIRDANKRGIVLVEDFLSSVKVGRWAGALPLLGSNLSHSKRVNMKTLNENLVFWLDYDKRDLACNYAQQCALLGYNTRVIVTKEDPKCLSDDDIRECLAGVDYGKEAVCAC